MVPLLSKAAAFVAERYQHRNPLQMVVLGCVGFISFVGFMCTLAILIAGGR